MTQQLFTLVSFIHGANDVDLLCVRECSYFCFVLFYFILFGLCEFVDCLFFFKSPNLFLVVGRITTAVELYITVTG